MISAEQLAAQQAVTATGGDASGSGGTAAYSVGQIVYTEISGSGGSALQGVQQPYEIYVLDSHIQEPVSIIMKVYPNPTLSDVVLQLGNMSLDKVDYVLFDIQGRLLLQRRITQDLTTIPMERYPRGTYLLKVSSDGEMLKTFKILKNAL